jgi:3-oxoacyl-[acyl-carrier protein] reductase
VVNSNRKKIMSKKLSGKIAMVTGASRGIGRAISIALAQQGSTVVLTGRDEEKLAETSKEIVATGSKAVVYTVDMEIEDSIKSLVKRAESRFGNLDILINNAGLTHSADFEDITTEAWDKCMRVNARGPFILCREAMGLLKKAKRGYIINISSVVGIKGYAKQVAYSASKHAIRGMSIAMSNELAGTNIRVHVLCPGGVDTDMVDEVRPDIKKDELIGPEEIAELVVYLVTHKGNAVIDELHIRRLSSTPWFIS